MADPIIAGLKNIKQGDKNLHQHLKQFISALLLDRSSLDNFEGYSAQQRVSGGVNECIFKVREAYSHLREFDNKNKGLLAKLNSGTEEEPQEPASIGYVPDLQEEARVFQKFGLGFGEEETYRIFKSLSRFSLKKNAKYIRLWGKITGSEKDYYIAEGQADAAEESGQLSPDTEVKGVGANKWSFWACTDLTEQWTQLPLVTPSQLKTSRKIKYIFTGNLNKTVLTNPLFPGKEGHLLKCQLVRIQTSCTIVPRGSLIINPDSNEIQAPEEYIYPEIGTLAQKENWIYQNASLLKNGRTTLLKPEGLEAEQEQKWIKAQSQLDPSEARLKNIVLDSEKWSVKGKGIEQVYRSIGKNSKSFSNGCVGIKNLVWPGWLTVAYGFKTISVYIGYGHKFKQNYYPFDPETVMQEGEDRDEFVVVEE